MRRERLGERHRQRDDGKRERELQRAEVRRVQRDNHEPRQQDEAAAFERPHVGAVGAERTRVVFVPAPAHANRLREAVTDGVYQQRNHDQPREADFAKVPDGRQHDHEAGDELAENPDQRVGAVLGPVEGFEHQLVGREAAANRLPENQQRKRHDGGAGKQVFDVGKGGDIQLPVNRHRQEENRDVVQLARVIDPHAASRHPARGEHDGEQRTRLQQRRFNLG